MGVPDTWRAFASRWGMLIVLGSLGIGGIGGAREAGAQTLRGSEASVARTYGVALRHRYTFARTSRDVRRGVQRGTLIAIRRGPYTLKAVSAPYLLPHAARELTRLGSAYRRACGERLVVTSATRSVATQPRNSSERSVHPTGMAFDLRRPRRACLRWLRRELLRRERSGWIDATEERFPAHFHVVVFARREAVVGR